MENTQLLKSFGIVIKKLRNEKGISQEKLAELVELHRTYIGDIERGARNVSLVNICRIAEGLDVRLGALFEEMEKEMNN